MISKYLAPALAATVLLAGLTATPASALTGSETTPSPTATATASPAPGQDPTENSTAQPVAPSPTATSQPVAPTKSPTPTTTPTQAPKATATESPAPTQPTPAPTQAPALKPTVFSGDLSGKGFALAKRDWKKLQGTASSATSGRYFEIQVYRPATKGWEKLTYGYTSADGAWVAYLDSTTDDSQTLRFTFPKADSSYAAYTGPSTTVTRTKGTFAINTTQNPTTIHGVPWEQREFKIWTSIYTDKLTAQLERYDGKKWIKVSSLTTDKSQYQYSFKLPKGTTKSKDQTLKYRVTMPASTYYGAVSSKAIDVRWENPNFYKGTQKTAYSYTAKQCPAVLVRMDGSLEKKGRWGEAALTYNDTKYYKLYTKIPAKHLKTVALHECSHFHQFATAINANNKGWDAYKAAANKLMGTKGDTGMERVNECMSDTWAKHSYWSYGASAKLCSQPKVKDFVQKSLKGQKVT